ncbi:MAG TPA: DUF2207 domain-containing protein [Microlunatus sp.]|nr:DUF2207 domain-containing protein [Microlunatus sp.]
MRRTLRTIVLLLAGLALAVGFSLAASSPAYAASDQIDEFEIQYEMGTDGVLHAKETIVWRFGDSSGRHGIDRYFVTREPYDDQQDAVYTVDVQSVTSPDPGVATQFSENTYETDGGRGEQLRIRIGDPDETISGDTATYVITYTVKGAMRTFSGYDEFYWDATGSDWEAPMKNVSVKVTVPDGAQELSCFAGPVQSKTPCTSDTITDGVAEFRQDSIPAGQGLTVGVKIKSGLIADNAPHLEPDGSKLSSAEKVGLIALAGTSLASLVLAPIIGARWWRKNGRDQRYAGLAPGTVPLPGQQAPIVPSDPDLPIPVAFTPPRIPVAEAGLLIDGQVDTRETAATIIDLAVRGALTVQSTGKDDFRVTLVDPDRATAPHEMVLLTEVFGGQPPGTQVDLSTQGSLTDAHNAMQKSVRNQVASRGWFRKVPSATATSSVGFGAIVFLVFLAFTLGIALLLVVLPLLPILVTFAIIRFKLRRGQRTADGRAVCDQVEGFKTYLATAEADQIRFEEGEDVFSKYLPWAIAFELADRWAKICGDLVAMGRLPNEVPYWYSGSYNMAVFNTSFITSSLTTAAAPAPSAGSSGTGFGGGSSFGGGGFSGGGGGGGGGGSW